MDLVIQALGNIKTSFQPFKLLWEIQKLECDSLLDENEEVCENLDALQIKNNTIYQNQTESKIFETMIYWMALFKINRDAYISIEVILNIPYPF